jgi:tetratricopeptide (TPR) repeat protein
MASTSKLKDRARAAENRDQWNEAVNLYRKALDEAEGDEVEVALWNKVGDLHLRLNQTDRAVQAYETAADAYAESGLHNNAIALCRKILRLVPGRAPVYLKLGQISAAAGFLADARQNFLEYADRMRRAGKVDESFAALKEFADLSPEETDVRRLLAEQLASHGRTSEAVEQLRTLLGMVLEDGDAKTAAQVREQIRALDPAADDSPIAPKAAADVVDDGFTGMGLDPYGAAAAAGLEVLDPSGAPEAPPAETPPAPGFDTGRYDEEAGVDGSPPPVDVAPLEIEHTSLRPEEDGAEAGAADLPLIDPDAPPAPEVAGRGGDEAGDAEPLPMMDLAGEPPPPRPAAAARPAPVPAPAPPEAPHSVEALRARVREAPEDRAAVRALVRALRVSGQHDEVLAVLEANHRALGAAAHYGDALWPVTELLRLRPGDGILLQKRVEYAFRAGDREAQVGAYLELGRHLAQQGDAGKSRAVFQRVLELQPDHPEARAAIAPPPKAMPPGPARAAPPAAEDYVDLGSLVMEEEPHEASTRFVVEEREPTGDEDRDFAEMLAHFRQKVAENIQVEDSTSHYDLGVAFKEMGLLDEAIAEFQVALRGGASMLATLEMLGQCFFEKGQFAVGGRVLDRALQLPRTTDANLVGVLYLLGRIAEASGQPDRALRHYERVLAVDIRFRDAQDRLAALRAGSREGGSLTG